MTDAGRSPCEWGDGGLTIRDFVRIGNCEVVVPPGGLEFAASMDEEAPMKKRHAPAPETEPTTEPAVAPVVTTATMPPIVGQMTASVGVPENAIAEVKSLVPANGDASMVTVALAVVGVAGGGAAWKFYQSHSKNKHEQAMKALEIEQQRSEKQEDKHQSCAAERVALEARVTALTARVEELAAKQPSTGSSFDLGDFDPEELDERLKKLEASLKPVKGKKR